MRDYQDTLYSILSQVSLVAILPLLLFLFLVPCCLCSFPPRGPVDWQSGLVGLPNYKCRNLPDLDTVPMDLQIDV